MKITMKEETHLGHIRCRMLRIDNGEVGQCEKAATHKANGLRLCQMHAEAVMGTCLDLYEVEEDNYQ